VEEVLLTPVDTDLPKEPSSIIIDNGCFSINRDLSLHPKLNDHIERCLELKKDPRCIFVLPDIRHSKDLAIHYMNVFMKRIRPKKFVLVDVPHILENYKHLIDDAEFLAIPSNREKHASFDLKRYHLFGRNPTFTMARSWDDLLFDATLPLKDQVLLRSR
jgi:hypothetical protein